MTKNIKYFILTGDPGVGKTTLTKKLCTMLSDKGIKTAGFITEEVRRNRVREGFDVVTLDGERGRLARDQNLLPIPARISVGKYGVLIEEFENVALPSMNMPVRAHPCVLVIDEIGKMELFSASFTSKIKEIFSPNSNNIVLATIPIRRGDPLIESIRNDSNSKVITVTRENRNYMQDEILQEMYTSLKL